MIRQVLPSVIAADIIGVQPMQGAGGSIFSMRYTFGNEHKPVILKFSKIRVDQHWNIWFESGIGMTSILQVEEWLKQFPKTDYWTYQKDPWSDFYVNIYNEEILTAFTLRWQNSQAA